MPILSSCEVGPSHISLLLNPITIPISELEKNRLSRITNLPPQKNSDIKLEKHGFEPSFIQGQTKPFIFHYGRLPRQLQHIIVTIMPCLPTPSTSAEMLQKSLQRIFCPCPWDECMYIITHRHLVHTLHWSWTCVLGLSMQKCFLLLSRFPKQIKWKEQESKNEIAFFFLNFI